MLNKIKNFGKVVAYALVLSVSFIGLAEANVFGTATDKALQIFQNVRNITFILGGFGLVGLAFGAIFGRVQWKWFGALAFGLAVVAAAGAIIDYVTTAETTGVAKASDFGGFNDTLQ